MKDYKGIIVIVLLLGIFAYLSYQIHNVKLQINTVENVESKNDSIAQTNLIKINEAVIRRLYRDSLIFQLNDSITVLKKYIHEKVPKFNNSTSYSAIEDDITKFFSKNK
jgi:hypothetical protein